MGEIKSAWEIAMEKVEKLEKLSPEELREKQEEEYALLGQVLANKYLGGLDQWQLEVELDKHSSDKRALLKEAVVSKLAQAIELGNYERLDRIIEGISYLKQGKAVRDIGNEIIQIFQEYKQVEQKEGEETERSAKEILHQLRISGSAVGAVNPKAIGECQQSVERPAQPYREMLDSLKQKLIDLPPEVN